MKSLHLDLETYCELDIAKVGLFKYVSHKSFKILLLSYRYSDELFTTTIDLTKAELPASLVEDMANGEVIKKAWNVFFEFVCLSKYIAKNYIELPPLDFRSWRCTMSKAAYNGYPLKLESAAQALKLGLGKMAEGKKLIKFFCSPIKKPIKKNGFRTRNLPEHDPGKWLQFIKYNSIDVDVEVEIDYLLPYEMPEYELDLFYLDYLINSGGIMLDLDFVRQAVRLVHAHFEKLIERSREITGLDNPNSVPQLTKWYEQYTGHACENLKADTIEKILKHEKDEKVREVLINRQELSLSSVKKYLVMLRMADKQGIVRGMHQYYGANRTGRWAGRGVQVHNLPKQGDYKPHQITIMRGAIHYAIDRDALSLIFSDVLAILKILLRTAFIPRPGHSFIIADWSAIEARILAWLSGEKWRIEVFSTHGKIYEASAAKMLKVPIDHIKKPSKERDRGKVAELALGYQGSVGALIRMGALEMGLSEKELLPLVMTWRRENPAIADKQRGLWARCEKAFKTAFEYPGKIIRFAEGRLAVSLKSGTLVFTLPSGRQLFYPNAKLSNSGEITYTGIDQTNKKWKKTQLYGGKIVENAIQAIARDVLAEGIKQVSKRLAVVMHVHDELVIECPISKDTDEEVEFVNKIMTQTPTWAPGLILKCDIFTSSYYRKN